MDIQIAVKSTSKTKNIEPRIYSMNPPPRTLRSLIQGLVELEIQDFEEKKSLKVLSTEEIDAMVESGKVTFGFRYGEDKSIDIHQAKENALQAFEDELFVVFIDETRIYKLDDQIDIKKENLISLIRLTMLSGRYF